MQLCRSVFPGLPTFNSKTCPLILLLAQTVENDGHRHGWIPVQQLQNLLVEIRPVHALDATLVYGTKTFVTQGQLQSLLRSVAS